MSVDGLVDVGGSGTMAVVMLMVGGRPRRPNSRDRRMEMERLTEFLSTITDSFYSSPPPLVLSLTFNGRHMITVNI